MTDSPTSDRDANFSRISVGAAAALLITAPLHAVAYLRDEGYDEGGAIDWARSAFDAVPALWDWSSSHQVYLWYGRVTSVLLVLMLLGAIALHRRQRRPERAFERWSFRAFAVAATLLCIGALLEYYTPFTDEIFLAVALPGLALTLITGTIYGIATARGDAVPTWMGVLLALAFLPGMPILVALLGHIPVGMSLNAIAWIVIGRHLRRTAPAT
jgi:hypothetical protein